MPDLKLRSPFDGCGIHKPSDGSEPYILKAGPEGTEKISLDGGTQELGGRLNRVGYNVRIVSLGDKTYAFGSEYGWYMEVWNGRGWDMAPQEFKELKAKRYYSGVMAVPKDFVC